MIAMLCAYPGSIVVTNTVVVTVYKNTVLMKIAAAQAVWQAYSVGTVVTNSVVVAVNEIMESSCLSVHC